MENNDIYCENRIGIYYDNYPDKDKLQEQLQSIGFKVLEYKLIKINYFEAVFDAEINLSHSQLETIIINNIENSGKLTFEPVKKVKAQKKDTP